MVDASDHKFDLSHTLREEALFTSGFSLESSLPVDFASIDSLVPPYTEACSKSSVSVRQGCHTHILTSRADPNRDRSAHSLPGLFEGARAFDRPKDESSNQSLEIDIFVARE
ncbi:hypothetical protein WAI453_004421 [Rhynchosporium graminicola]